MLNKFQSKKVDFLQDKEFPFLDWGEHLFVVTIMTSLEIRKKHPIFSDVFYLIIALVKVFLKTILLVKKLKQNQ